MRDEEIRAAHVGELRPHDGPITLVDHDPAWPQAFRREERMILETLGHRALRVEHCGSTSVPGLAAKPIIDIVLAVEDSSDEPAYVPALEAQGYQLWIREPSWMEHRMLRRVDPSVNLHVFSAGCPEVERMVAFRDHLRAHRDDRERYERTKRALAARRWRHVQNYADAKTDVVEEIMSRARGSSAEPPSTATGNPAGTGSA